MLDADITYLMRKVFPRIDEYEINTMTSSLGSKDGEPIISMLIYADDLMIEDFRKSNNIAPPIEITTYTERNRNGMGKDFGIRLDFLFPTGHPVFDTFIYADDRAKQVDYMQALLEVKELYLWIANKDKSVEFFMTVPFDKEECRETIEGILYPERN